MAAVSGKRLVKDAQVMTERMAPGVYTAPAPNDKSQGGANAVQFQRKFDARSRYDDEMNTKMALMDKNGMTPFGQVYYDDKVGRWLQEKEAASEAANFDSYFNTNFNKNDLASRQWAQQIHPEFYETREREMNERAELVLKLKKIQLRGPQTEEDLKILYLIEQGRVVLPKNWDTIGVGYEDTSFSDKAEGKNQKNFLFGLVRMPLFLNHDTQKERAAQNKKVGAWGDSNVPQFFNASGADKPFARPSVSNAYSPQPFKFAEFLGVQTGIKAKQN